MPSVSLVKVEDYVDMQHVGNPDCQKLADQGGLGITQQKWMQIIVDLTLPCTSKTTTEILECPYT